MAMILCIETGTDICSVALSKSGELISLRESDQGRNHAQNLAVFIDEILTQNNLDFDCIDAVAVGFGPGSYTGLRIGVSLAKGLCYSSMIPLIAVSSLESLTKCALEDQSEGVVDMEISDNTILCPMIDARRMEVYTQLFDQHIHPLSEIEAKVIDETSFVEYRHRDFVIFGNGAHKCLEILNLPNITYAKVAPSARGMVESAYRKFVKKEFEDLAYFEPMYLKNFIGTQSKKNNLGLSNVKNAQ